jgi:hypothetical protein
MKTNIMPGSTSYDIVVLAHQSNSIKQYRAHDEPQGLAAAEAWSMDVPIPAFHAPGYENIATIPYSSPATGAYWSSTDELQGLIADFSAERFQPRKWVLANMT